MVTKLIILTFWMQIYTDCFGKYSLGPKILLTEFEEFLKKEQHERNASEYNSFFRDFSKTMSGSRKAIPYLTSNEVATNIYIRTFCMLGSDGSKMM